MKIIKINPKNPHSDIIEEAVETLRQGGVLVYPTDTCYGLGVDMTNIFAVEKIYRIKGREHHKPLSMIVRNLDQLQKYALLEAGPKGILEKNLPGPFTFIMLNLDYRTFKQPTIGIRIPDYKITQMISKRFHQPYATTSANRSGNLPCYSVSCILKELENSETLPGLILDAGTLSQNPPSTVVDLTKDNPLIIREGKAKLKL